MTKIVTVYQNVLDNEAALKFTVHIQIHRVDGRLESYFKIIDQEGRFTSFSPLPEAVTVNGEFLYPLTSYQFKTQIEKFGYNFLRKRGGADGIVIGPIHRLDLTSDLSNKPLTIPCWSDEDEELNSYYFASTDALENPIKDEFDKPTNTEENRRRRESFPFSFVHIKFDKKNTNRVSYINFNAHLHLLLGDDNLDGGLTPISNSPIMREKGLGEYLAKRKNLSDSDKRGISWLPNISGTISKDVDENELRILAGTETLRDEVPITSRGFLRRKVSVENLLPTEYDVLSYTPLPIDDKNGVLEQPVNHNQNLTIAAISCALKPKQIKIANEGIPAAQVSVSFSELADDWGQTYYTPRFTRSMYTEHGWINLSQELDKVLSVLNPGKKYPYGHTCDIVHRIYCENLPTGHGLDFWNEIVEDYLSSIDIAGQGLSYLPKFSAENPDSPIWSFEAEIKHRPIFQFIDEGAIVGRVPVYGTNPYKPSGISKGSIQHLITSSKGTKTAVDMKFEGINLSELQPIKMHLDFNHEIDSKNQTLRIRGKYNHDTKVLPKYNYSIGALNITWQSAVLGEAGNFPQDNEDDLSIEIFRGNTNTESSYKHSADEKITQKISLNLRAPVIIKPIGQDDPPDGLYQNQSSFHNISNEALIGIARDFQADTSAVHTVMSETANQGLVLTIDEQSSIKPAPQYRRVRHTLKRISSGTEKNAIYPTYVLDTHPFYIIKVNVQEDALLGRADGTGIVAYYDNNEPGGARWIFRDQTNQVVFCLPPQTVGEAMEKGAIDGSSNSIDIQEIERPDSSIVIEPVDFKFSPIATLHINLEERSAIPQAPWNIRNLLISSAPDLPGTKLHKAVFDLAYGMETTLASSDLRLVESFAWRGQPPRINYLDLADFDGLIKKIGDLTVQKDIDYLTPYKDLRLEKFKNWGQSYKTWSKRLALFEVRDEQEKNGSLFRDEDVDFRLRAGVTAWPISPKKTAQALAKPGTIKNALSLTPRPEEVGRELKQLLLAGGVLWGAEESVILENLVKSPKSIGGSIGRLAFSALGGWGDQEAHFDKGLTIIKTNTDQGRLNGYTLIRMGRIAVFWNLARHVIEFERVPLRSEQFYQQNDGWGGQEKHEGHMVLRKTREYIEIIDEETELNLPVVKGTKFQKTINVDSNWSEIVNDKEAKPTGYKIPLWQRQAALDKPTVYQFPDIKIRAAAGAETEQALQADETQGQKTPTVLCGCANPNDIYFYTQTKTPLSESLETDAAVKAKGSDDQYEDPRSWDPVYLVDFIDLPMDYPDPNKLRASDFRKEDDRELLDEHPECAPGYDNFTFKLKDSARINLLDGKAATNIAAKVKNLTVMRAVTPGVLPRETSDSPDQPPRVEAANFLANRQNKSTQIRAVNELYRLSLKVEREVGKAIKQAESFENICATIIKSIGWNDIGSFPKTSVLGVLNDFISKPENKPLVHKTKILLGYFESLGRNINELKDAVSGHNLKDLLEPKDASPFSYKSWLKKAEEKIIRIKEVAFEVVNEVRIIISFVAALRKNETFENSVGKALKNHFDNELTALEQKINDEIERVNKQLIPLHNQAKKVFDEALKVRTDLKKYESVASDIIGKIKSDDFCQELRKEFDNKFEREVKRGRSKILSFQQRTSNELDGLAEKIKDEITAAEQLTFLENFDKTFKDNLSRLDKNSSRVFEDIRAAIETIKRQLNSKIVANDLLLTLKLNNPENSPYNYQLHKELDEFIYTLKGDLPSKTEIYNQEISDWSREKLAALSSILDQEISNYLPLNTALRSVISDYKNGLLKEVKIQLNTLPLYIRKLGINLLGLLEREFDQTLEYILHEGQDVFEALNKSLKSLRDISVNSFKVIGAKIEEFDKKLEQGIDVEYKDLRAVIETSLDEIQNGLKSLLFEDDGPKKAIVEVLKNKLEKSAASLRGFLGDELDKLKLPDKAKKLESFWGQQVDALKDDINKERDVLEGQIETILKEVNGEKKSQRCLALIDEKLRYNSNYVQNQFDINTKGSWANQFRHYLMGDDGSGGIVEESCEEIKTFLDDLLKKTDIEAAIKNLDLTVNKIVEAARTILAEIEDIDQVLLKAAKRIIEKIPDDFEFNLPDAELYLSRVFSYMPEISDLGFNRLASAFYYDLEKAVRTLPVSTLIDRFGEQLKGMSISLPTIDISDYFNPPNLNWLGNFDVGDILPDFGFLKNKGLFNGKSIGKDAFKNIKITHDIDKKQKIAWAKAAVNINLGTANLLPTKVVRVQIIDAKLDGHLRIQTDIQGNVEREVKSKLSGNWALGVSSTTILTMKETAVNYDERSGVTFDFDPKNIDYSGGLKFLKMISDKYQKTQEEGPPPIVERLFGDGLPYGFYNYFHIPIPDIASGPFVLSNLELNTLLAAQLNLEDLRNPDFTLTAAAELSKEDDPFLMLIAFLGGTGYINIDTSYSIFSQDRETNVNLGLGAAAGGAFALGPIKGTVSIKFMLEAHYHDSGRGGSSLSISARILLNGNVKAWVVSISIAVSLSVTYTKTQTIGHGYISVKVRICKFVKKKFKKNFKKRLSGSGGDTAKTILPAEDLPTPAMIAAQKTEVAETLTSSDINLSPDNRKNEVNALLMSAL